ncbi:MAG: tRNA guanosine(34) transglycosylase Tgt [Patescibacteria group bacterium]
MPRERGSLPKVSNDKDKIMKKPGKISARTRILKTRHGLIKTPFFMPIATKAAVKSVTTDDLLKLETQIILSNTYHLYLRPGVPVIKKAGGLHRFMNWHRPILTDSGGYQVFSLAKFRKITSQGVFFKDNLSGRSHFISPEKAIQIQIDLGADIIMSFDECSPHPCSKDYAEKSMNLTTAWAKRGFEYFKKHKKPGQLLFGIIQGSIYKDLRIRHAKEITSLPFDGFAVGGLAVGEPERKMYSVLEWLQGYLPASKLRYLMGVGYPDQIVKAVNLGLDMFDCVLPTRNARHGVLYVWRSKNPSLSGKDFYQEIKIKQARYTFDLKPIDPYCDCRTCRDYSRAYLRHLFLTQEPLALTLATIHNIRFYNRLMERLRLKKI